jgi:ABC-2 type transport system permease protein
MIRQPWLVARREILAQARSKSFIVSISLVAVLAFAGSLIASLATGGSDFGGLAGAIGGDDDGETVKVAVVGEMPPGQVEGFELIAASSKDEAEAMLRDSKVEAAVLVPPDPAVPVTVIGLDSEPDNVVNAFTVRPAVELMEPPRVNPVLGMVVTMVCGLLVYMLVAMFGSIAAQNTVVEKQTRVVEILLTAVSARALMAGKVLGNSIMALSQVAVMLVALIAGLLAGGNGQFLSLVSGSMVWFLVFFAVGFVMFSSLLAGTAALVSRIEDVSSAISPVLMILMVPYILVFVQPTNVTLHHIMAYIPFSAPTFMPPLVLTGAVAWWEPVISLVLLLVTTWLAILVGAKIYSSSLLRTGSKIKFREALASKA